MSLMVVLYSIEYHGHEAPPYESVNHMYVRYVTQKYGAAAIVFDGYNDTMIRQPKMPHTCEEREIV